MEIKRKEGESAPSAIYRFNKRVQQSGLVKEVKSRRFTDRNVNKNSRRNSALYREDKAMEVKKLRKLGKI